MQETIETRIGLRRPQAKALRGIADRTMRDRLALVLLTVCAIPWALRAEGRPDSNQADVNELIRQLGDPDYAVREAATRKLHAAGPEAMEALAEAMRSEDPEVRTRAKRVCEGWRHPTAERVRQFRNQRQLSLDDGDYRRMIDIGRRLTLAEGAELGDWLWLGHACQLASEWRLAVGAYRQAIELLGKDRRHGPWGGPGRIIGPRVALEVRGAKLVAADPKKVLEQQSLLAIWVAYVQMEELKDAAGAAETLTELVRRVDGAKIDAGWAFARALELLALAREKAGDLPGTFRACGRRWAVESAYHFDNPQVRRIVAALAAGGNHPSLALFVLTPSAPTTALLPEQAETQARAYVRMGERDLTNWRYAFAAPPGKEFAAVEFACHIEQIDPTQKAQLSCFVPVDQWGLARKDLGQIVWPQEAPGREVVRRTFSIPRGTMTVHIQTGSSKGHFRVHRIDVRATFREATEAAARRRGVWMQTEVHPKGGTLTCGTRALRDMVAYTKFPPGAYILRYEVPGRTDARELDYVIESGWRHGIFINLDSPFRWRQLGRTGAGWGHPPKYTSLVRLPDGTWLAVWASSHSCLMPNSCLQAQTIQLARSKDLETWTPMQRAPFCSVFGGLSPATCVGPDGTVFVAYLSKRLDLLDGSSGGFSMWMTHTRDGKQWAPSKLIAPRVDAGWPLGAIQLARGRDGTCCVFWADRVGTAESFDKIRGLAPVQVADKGPRPHSPHVVADEKRRLHAVWSGGEQVLHSMSLDGRTWSKAAVLVEGGSQTKIASPQLVLGDGKAAVIYEHSGAYVLPVRLGGPAATTDAAIKITGHVIPLCGARATVTPDGEVLLLAGDDTTWLLRAKLADVLAGRKAQSATKAR